MSATARRTITLALRRYCRVIGLGQAPSSAQAEEALGMLNDFLNQLVGNGGSLPFQDVPVASGYAIPNKTWPALRMVCQHGAPISLTLPTGSARDPIPDGFRLGVVDASGAAATNNITLARNGWKIAGLASNYVINTNNASPIFMFRGDLGDWKLAADLGLDDDLPFPSTFDQGMAAIMGDLLCGGYGRELSRSDYAFAEEARSSLRAKYCAPSPTYFSSEVANIGDGSGRTGSGSLDDFLNGVA